MILNVCAAIHFYVCTLYSLHARRHMWIFCLRCACFLSLFLRSFAHLLSRTGIVGRVQQILAEANGSYKSLDFDTYNTCSCHDWAREPRHSFDRVVVLYIRSSVWETVRIALVTNLRGYVITSTVVLLQ